MIPSSRQHKYQEISAAVSEIVAAAPAGGLLQSERELARMFNCNVLTVRKALQPFAEQGLIIRRTGSGTFRSDAPLSALRNPRLIGVLFHSRSDSYAACVAQAFRSAADNAAVTLRPAWTEAFGEDARKAAADFAAAGCGAMVIPWAPAEQFGALTGFLRDCPLPVCLPMLLRHYEECCFESPERFGSDIDNDISALYEYFSALGRKTVAYLGPDLPEAPNLQRTIAVYSSLCSRRGADNSCALVGPDAASMNALARRWQSRRGDLAVIAYDDSHALRFMAAMHKLGLSAPRDYAILGHNNIAECKLADPPLSSVEHDFAYVGDNLLRSAVARARGETLQGEREKRCRLIVRASCGGAGALTPELRRKFSCFGILEKENS